jgi:hypothetical protein
MSMVLVFRVLILVAASAGLHGVVERSVSDISRFVGRHPLVGAIAFTGLAAMSAMPAFFSSALAD